ncbi:substrate-binding domain-containing protein [Caldicellulosiruptor morganii]|uniref:Substrate-binding domain-containing protein n=1 Tax=Caldicellulosiruptor morganii TaxID=1387555 RepID=A0ABY7BLH1_9FIRM|nr:substrate-binding domain-containing protein [Caldicellulosiruptor morganii]WAM33670.1 substrate-binding domain-containing protein [Caldicellulosiruptor morganii]
MNKRVTMKDIAERLGVSKVTVSKALKDSPDISQALKEKVIKTAQEMGYIYNAKGRMLRENLTYSIGVISSEKYYGKDDYFYIDLYKHLSNSFEKLGFTTTFNIISRNDEESLSVPNALLEQKIDGVVILGQMSIDYIKRVLDFNCPTIFLDFYCDRFNVDCVITDNFFATYEITNMLIEQGHREIGFVGNIHATSSIQDRFLGYYKALLENRIELNKDWIIKDRDDNNNFIDILLPGKLPTAFVCNCDKTAYLTIEKLKSAGYKVPDDISVVGFDDSLHAVLSSPKITTVRVNMEEMGRRTAKIMFEKIKQGEKHYGKVLIKGKIIVRESAKPLK